MILLSVSAAGGLSPRVRGNRNVTRGRISPYGSIPACAGEPRGHLGWAALPTVYPRVCGGTYLGVEQAGRNLGLSPRVRGNP